MKENEVNKWLFEVQHPAKGDRNVVELGMVENVAIEEGKVSVTLAFSKHRDPLAEYLIGSTKAAIIRNAPAGTEVEVKTIIKDEAPKKKPGLDLGARRRGVQKKRSRRNKSTDCRKLWSDKKPDQTVGCPSESQKESD